MACFIVPGTEAIVTTVVTKAVEAKEKKSGKVSTEAHACEHSVKIPFSHKLKWLSNLLWGGSAMLAFEHLWHGEIMPEFPFLTNALNAQDAAEMIHEMGTTGVGMACLVTAVWGGMVVVSNVLAKKKADQADKEEA